MEKFKVGERVKFRRYICDIVRVHETGYTARIVGEGYVFHGSAEEFKPLLTEWQKKEIQNLKK